MCIRDSTASGDFDASIISNAIALAIHTGAEECPFFLWDTGTAAMSWGEVEKLRAEEQLGSRNSRGEAPGTLPVVNNQAILSICVERWFPRSSKTSFAANVSTLSTRHVP